MKRAVLKTNEAVAYQSGATKTNNLNMKKAALVFLLFRLILNADTYGQSTFEKFFYKGEFYSGFVALNNGVTIKGHIIFENSYENYLFVKIKDITNNKITSYRPKDVLVFSFDSLYFYPKKFNRNKDVFMCLLSDDQLKVYLHRFQSNSGYVVESGTHSNSVYVAGTGIAYILEKPDGQEVKIVYDKRFNLKKHAGDFFKDCPHVSKKINNKTYNALDILKIADEYIEWLKQPTDHVTR